jgi:putative phage-type endonuclease
MDFIMYLEEVVTEYKKENILKIADPNYIKEIFTIVNNNCKEFMSEEEIILLFDNNINTILVKCNFIRYEEWYKSIINVNPLIIEQLSSIKQPEQKTTEWYLFRHDHITASNAWKALSTQSTKNQLIYEKCLPINSDKYKPSLNENSLTWGHKYEPLSSAIYEFKMKAHIKEFGCIEHPVYNFLAASPDGIVVSENNYGRMIEIKNVVSRVIDGIPKKEYYIQMQLQMEVCNLDECDFVETKFIEYDGYQDYVEDNAEVKGIILSFIGEHGYIYKYMPFNKTLEEIDIWMEEIKQSTPAHWFKNIYWKLDVFSCVLVKRNKEWFNCAINPLKEIWDIICMERQNGEYLKRAPKKKEKGEKNGKEKENFIQIVE